MNDAKAPAPAQGASTLAIDIGGSHLKAGILTSAGVLAGQEARVVTPSPATPDAVVAALAQLVAPLGAFDRISVGFPGVVRDGVVFTAPTLHAKGWNGYDLDAALTKQFAKPVRILNDAVVQGLGVIKGTGLECVLTMGTGMGFALFYNGHLAPPLEMSQHPIHDGDTYNDYVGDAALKDVGKKRWNKRIHKIIGILATVVNYDVLYIGGGNSRHVKEPLPENVKLTSNSAGVTGGVRLWDERMDEAFADRPPFAPPRQ